MSGYLARMAARAAGSTPSALPRLPARFEAASEDTATDAPIGQGNRTVLAGSGLASAEILGPEARALGVSGAEYQGPQIPGRAEPPPASSTFAETTPVRASASTGVGLVGPTATTTRPSESATAPASASGGVVLVGTPKNSGQESSAPVQRTGTPADARFLAPAVPPAAAPAVSAVPIRPAVPALHAAEAFPVVPSRQANPVPEPVVRISIGRVEVRAALSTVPPPPQARSTPRPGPIPLQDYLRGRREAP